MAAPSICNGAIDSEFRQLGNARHESGSAQAGKVRCAYIHVDEVISPDLARKAGKFEKFAELRHGKVALFR